MWKGVASVAEFVLDIAFGTSNGPILRGPFSRVVSAAATMARVDGPPEPMMSPVRSWLISCSVSPESTIACCMAM